MAPGFNVDSIYANPYQNYPFTYNSNPIINQRDLNFSSSSDSYEVFMQRCGGRVYDPLNPNEKPNMKNWTASQIIEYYDIYTAQQQEHLNSIRQTEELQQQQVAEQERLLAEQQAAAEQGQAGVEDQTLMNNITPENITAAGTGYVAGRYYYKHTDKASQALRTKFTGKAPITTPLKSAAPAVPAAPATNTSKLTGALRNVKASTVSGAKSLGSSALKMGGRACVVVGVAMSAVDVYAAYKEGGAPAAVEKGTECVTGLAAGIAGAKIGAAIGTCFGPWGTVIGGAVGGIVGYIAGSKIGKKIGGFFKKLFG